MHFAALQYRSFEARLERDAMAQITDAFAPLFGTLKPRSRIGLIVASDNAGSASSLQFWADAMRVGVDVASPELFPWCLANAPCGALARQFGITGPNVTLLGEGEALAAALQTAADWLAQDAADEVVVAALSFPSTRLPAAAGSGRALALRMLAQEPPALGLPALQARLTPLPLRGAMETLQQCYANLL